MARKRMTMGIFRLKPGTYPREIDGEAIEKHSVAVEAGNRLAAHRAAHKVSGGNEYDIVLLPLDDKGRGLLPPGV